MLGAIAGDVIGSIREWRNVKTTDFKLFEIGNKFTDDTVLTVATADAILNNKPYAQTYKEYALKYPNAGYGGKFKEWMYSESLAPYGSFGNGSAMRISPVAWAYDTIEEVLRESDVSARCTHNHPEGIKGAQAIATAIYLARTGSTKQAIQDYVIDAFGYDLNFRLSTIRFSYRFNSTCQGSVPQAIVAFLESYNFESAIRNAISIGGDSDTIACMTGSIAEAFYKGVPQDISYRVTMLLDKPLREVMTRFIKEKCNGKTRK